MPVDCGYNEREFVCTKLWNCLAAKHRSRNKKTSSDDVIVQHAGTEPRGSRSEDMLRSSCGNYVLCGGKVVDIVLPYQRFVPTHQRRTAAPVADIDVSERGPMLTRVNGRFRGDRELKPLLIARDAPRPPQLGILGAEARTRARREASPLGARLQHAVEDAPPQSTQSHDEQEQECALGAETACKHGVQAHGCLRGRAAKYASGFRMQLERAATLPGR